MTTELLSAGDAAIWDQIDRVLIRIEAEHSAEPGVNLAEYATVTATAAALATLLRRTMDRPPDAVYPLPDGNVMFEWQRADVTERYEACPNRAVQLMTSYTDPARPTVFLDMTV